MILMSSRRLARAASQRLGVLSVIMDEHLRTVLPSATSTAEQRFVAVRDNIRRVVRNDGFRLDLVLVQGAQRATLERLITDIPEMQFARDEVDDPDDPGDINSDMLSGLGMSAAIAPESFGGTCSAVLSRRESPWTTRVVWTATPLTVECTARDVSAQRQTSLRVANVNANVPSVTHDAVVNKSEANLHGEGTAYRHTIFRQCRTGGTDLAIGDWRCSFKETGAAGYRDVYLDWCSQQRAVGVTVGLEDHRSFDGNNRFWGADSLVNFPHLGGGSVNRYHRCMWRRRPKGQLKLLRLDTLRWAIPDVPEAEACSLRPILLDLEVELCSPLA